jgi:UDPglucose--hexose-1-phosphate uridylyltransferase
MNFSFKTRKVLARFLSPAGAPVERVIEFRTNPLTGRRCRIAFSRTGEQEAGTDRLPEPPPSAAAIDECPFCPANVDAKTPGLNPGISNQPRLHTGGSTLFPNLYPYGSYSAVSLLENAHFVEIGKARPASYFDCLLNCQQYLAAVRRHDPAAVYISITQNHLPSAGGSLVHPHLQTHADSIASNYHAILEDRSEAYYRQHNRLLFSDYLEDEHFQKSRLIGKTGNWSWVAAFAPEGFYEIWGILPDKTTMGSIVPAEWDDLANGIINTQKFYRSLNRNGYNLGLLLVEKETSRLEAKVSLMVRSNYSPWVRNDQTGIELMLGDMATFTAPEKTAELARPFWQGSCC